MDQIKLRLKKRGQIIAVLLFFCDHIDSSQEPTNQVIGSGNGSVFNIKILKQGGRYNMKNIIYSNDVCSMYDEIKKNPREFFSDEEGEVSDEQMWNEAYDQIELSLEDEQANLDIDLPGELILIGTLERWNGAYPVYKELDTRNIGEGIVKAMASFGGDNHFEVYVEDGKMKISQLGHDNPTNPSIMEFRQITVDLYDLDSDDTATLIANSLPIARQVCDVYGWDNIKEVA